MAVTLPISPRTRERIDRLSEAWERHHGGSIDEADLLEKALAWVEGRIDHFVDVA